MTSPVGDRTKAVEGFLHPLLGIAAKVAVVIDVDEAGPRDLGTAGQPAQRERKKEGRGLLTFSFCLFP